jgi:hypothetical protein
MPYSPVYTGTGVVEFSHPFSAFYQYKDVDWSKGVKQVALILKDENGTKMQGNPDFYPTRVRITLTVVRPGAGYVAPAQPGDASTPRDAAAPNDAASKPSPDAGPRDASQDSAAPQDGPTAPEDAAASPAWDAGSRTDGAALSGHDGTAPQALPSPAPSGGSHDEAGAPRATPDEAEDDAESGCSTRHTSPHSHAGWLLLAAAAAPFVNRPRSRRS